MVVPVTSIYAAAAALLLIPLSLWVIFARQGLGAAWGDGAEDGGRLMRLRRAHGNFVEYVPMALIVLLLAELQDAPAWVLHLAGLSLLVGRAVHAVGLTRFPTDLRFRIIGMVLTFTALGAGTIGAVAASFQG